MAGQVQGNVALVTGAASGIGRQVALMLAKEGAQVVVSDVSDAGGQETVRLMKDAGAEATFVRCDVSQPQEIEKLIETVVATYGKLDCAMNNAGIAGASAPTADYPLDSWNKVIAINLTAPWLCMKYEIPHMLKQGKGAIVNMASILGTTGFATKTAALEYSARGIRINAVCPGFIETPMLTNVGLNEATHKYISSLHPIGRMGKPEEIVAMVLWLCSDVASFVTGAAMLVDGGYTAQ